MNRETIENSRLIRKCYHVVNSFVRRKKLRAKIDETFDRFGIDRARIKNEEKMIS